MTVQKRNDEMVELLRADFFARYEPNASMVHAALIEQICALHSYWPCSALHNDGNSVFITDLANGHDLTCENIPIFGYDNLFPYVYFHTNQYATYAHDPQNTIRGNEAFVNLPGLAIGGWFYWVDRTALQGMMSKWVQLGNLRAYRLYKDAAHHIVFEVSDDGTAVAAHVNTVTSTGTVSNHAWYHIWGRFFPGIGVYVSLDNVTDSNLVAPVASIFNPNTPFTVARTDSANYLNGRISQLLMAGSWLTDSFVSVHWEQTRAWVRK